MILSYINDDFWGFQKLINFWDSHRSLSFGTVDIFLERFFSANMSAPLGAILDLLSIQNNVIVKAAPDIRTILQKNGFLSFYGYPTVWDNNNTTIQYIRFKRSESDAFAGYDRVIFVEEALHGAGIGEAVGAILGEKTVCRDLGSAYVPHGSLEALYRRQGLDPESIAALAREVLEA